MHSWRAVALASLMGGGLAACALFGGFRFERPTIDLTAVEVTGIGLTGGSLNLVLDVYNPNRYELRAGRLSVALALEETHFGDALVERPVVLPPREHTAVDVPLRFTWEGVGAGARALLTRGSVRYAMDGQFLAETPAGERGVELRTGGVVTIRDLVR